MIEVESSQRFVRVCRVEGRIVLESESVIDALYSLSYLSVDGVDDRVAEDGASQDVLPVMMIVSCSADGDHQRNQKECER